MHFTFKLFPDSCGRSYYYGQEAATGRPIDSVLFDGLRYSQSQILLGEIMYVRMYIMVDYINTYMNTYIHTYLVDYKR